MFCSPSPYAKMYVLDILNFHYSKRIDIPICRLTETEEKKEAVLTRLDQLKKERKELLVLYK